MSELLSTVLQVYLRYALYLYHPQIPLHLHPWAHPSTNVPSHSRRRLRQDRWVTGSVMTHEAIRNQFELKAQSQSSSHICHYSCFCVVLFRVRVFRLLLGLKVTLQIEGYGNSPSQKWGIHLNIGSGIEAKFSLLWLPTLWSSFCFHVASLSLDIDIFQALQLTCIMADMLSCHSREENTRETIMNYGSVQSVSILGRQNTIHLIKKKN